MTASRVRVAQLITKLDLGGAQETVLGLASGLDPDRFTVQVLCGPEAEPGGNMLADFADAEVDVELIPSLGRSVRAPGDARALRELCTALRRLRPDVVHTHTSKAGALGRMAARITRVPHVVHTVHGWSFGHGGGRYSRPMVATERLLARWSDRLVVVTPADKDTGTAHRIGNPSQYVLIRSGIDPGRFRFDAQVRAAARAEVGLDPDAEVVGTVGRLSEQKDPVTLLRAFHRLAKNHPRARLLVVGDGPLRPHVEQTIADLGLASSVHLVGADPDPSRWYPAMDVFALSSRWEGLPRVVLEAFACGLPVVSTRCGGMSEFERHADVTLCAIEDDASLAIAIADALDGLPHVRDDIPEWLHDYSVASMVSDTADMYEQLTRARLSV